jgi:2,5-diamino-6-(ribosylamino)-4(3H)-pyrimidinone 5'-phosphate reductase
MNVASSRAGSNRGLSIKGHRSGRHRPLVFLNMAMSADGKIATANRKVFSFGSARDRVHLLELRAQADAVMAGARTVDSQPVNLGPGPARYRRLRKRRGLAEYNLRIVVSRTGSVNPHAEIFRRGFSPILLLTTRSASAPRLARLRPLVAQVKMCGATQINFRRALIWLRKKWNVKRLLCEGGGELNDALFRAGLVDELHLTVCPKIFGGRFAPTIADGLGASSLAAASRFELKSAQRVGDEMFLLYRSRKR